MATLHSQFARGAVDHRASLVEWGLARNLGTEIVGKHYGVTLDLLVLGIGRPLVQASEVCHTGGPRRTGELEGIQDKITEVQDQGYCILKGQFARRLIDACRYAFWPVLLGYLQNHRHEPNRGPYRHFLPLPFEPPCFVPEFFFDNEVLSIVRRVMDGRAVADQWGCDVPLCGSEYQGIHVDYQRPLFDETPDLSLPAYMLVVNFGLVRIAPENGPIEIAPGTHRMPRKEAFRAVEATDIEMKPVPLEIGDVLIRHPWALHRGTPNTTDTPRALVSIRYVRRWYADNSREVDSIPHAVWESLTPEQRNMMRFPVAD